MEEIIIEIHAGEGGDDSKLFIYDLAAAYAKYAKANGANPDILFTGNSNVTLQITGQNASELFKNEGGGHVVQRVPPTERNGRRQTSCISVAVLNIPEYTDVKLKDTDLDITCAIGTGPGGQHRQKTASCVRVVHKPTKLAVVIDGRNQHKNKAIALKILAEKVKEHIHGKEQEKIDANRKGQLGTGGRGLKIRTYNFIKGIATDHRTEKQVNVREVIDKGRFNLLV